MVTVGKLTIYERLYLLNYWSHLNSENFNLPVFVSSKSYFMLKTCLNVLFLNCRLMKKAHFRTVPIWLLHTVSYWYDVLKNGAYCEDYTSEFVLKVPCTTFKLGIPNEDDFLLGCPAVYSSHRNTGRCTVNKGRVSYYTFIGKPQKKILFQVDSPLRPLSPLPFGSEVKRTATKKKKKIYFP